MFFLPAWLVCFDLICSILFIAPANLSAITTFVFSASLILDERFFTTLFSILTCFIRARYGASSLPSTGTRIPIKGSKTVKYKQQFILTTTCTQANNGLNII